MSNLSNYLNSRGWVFQTYGSLFFYRQEAIWEEMVYQEVCDPVTKVFREKLYAEIERAYNEALDKQKQEAVEKVQNGNDRSKQPKTYENEFIQMDSSPTPFG